MPSRATAAALQPPNVKVKRVLRRRTLQDECCGCADEGIPSIDLGSRSTLIHVPTECSSWKPPVWYPRACDSDGTTLEAAGTRRLACKYESVGFVWFGFLPGQGQKP